MLDNYWIIRKPWFKTFVTVFTVFLIFSCTTANAQRRHDPWNNYGGGGNGNGSDYAIVLGIDYDAPAAPLNNTYSPAPSFTLGVIRNLGDFTLNATLGYRAYSPKEAAFTFDDGDGETGSSIYSKFQVFAFYTGVVYNVQLGNSSKFYAGFNIGAYYTSYSYNEQDPNGTNSFNAIEEQAYIAPKIGLTFSMTQQLALGIEAKYNIFSPVGDSFTNPDAGTVFKSYSLGVTLAYGF